MNSRAKLTALIFVYLALIVFSASVLGLEPDTTIIDGVAYEIDSSLGWRDFFATFFKMLTFQVDLPFVITLFAIYPPMLLLIWNIAEMIRGN